MIMSGLAGLTSTADLHAVHVSTPFPSGAFEFMEFYMQGKVGFKRFFEIMNTEPDITGRRRTPPIWMP